MGRNPEPTIPTARPVLTCSTTLCTDALLPDLEVTSLSHHAFDLLRLHLSAPTISR